MKLRLTLRILLAYLDDVLDPEPARHIGRRIRESRSASLLVERLKRVVRRPIEAAGPTLADPESADRYRSTTPVDPNDLAEYLDSVLDAEGVAKLERRCLDSDDDLAELASVHQALAMVAENSAPVSKSARRRLIASGKDHGATSGGSVTRPMSTLDLSQPSPAPQPVPASENPSPLDAEPIPLAPPNFGPARSTNRTMALVVAGALAIAAFVWVRTSRTPGPDSARRAEAVAHNDLTGQQTESSTTESGAPVAPAVDSTKPAAERNTVTQAPRSPATVEKSGVSPKQPAPAESPPATASIPVLEEEPIPPAIGSPTPAAKAPVAPQPRKSKPEQEPIPDPARGTSPTGPVALALDTRSSSDLEGAPPSDLLATAVPRATYVADDSVLLRSTSDGWRRVPPGGYLYAKDHILGLDGFRPRLRRPDGSTIELVGPTELTLEHDGDVDWSVDLSMGRLALRSGRKPFSIRVRIGETPIHLRLTMPNSLVGFEQSVERLPTSDRGADRAARLLAVYVVRGRVEVRMGNETRVLEGGHEVAGSTRLGIARPIPSERFVSWIIAPEPEAEIRRELDRFAARVPFGQSIEPILREEIASRSHAVRPIAAGSLAVIGDFQGVVEAIRDAKYPDVRLATLTAMRACLRCDAQRVEALNADLLTLYDATDARNVTALMLGFSERAKTHPKTIEGLVRLLESPDRLIRELAIRNLRELFDRDFGYSADGSASRQATSVGYWREWLRSRPPQP